MAIIDKGKLGRYFINFKVNSTDIKQGSARTSLKDPLCCWRDWNCFYSNEKISEYPTCGNSISLLNFLFNLNLKLNHVIINLIDQVIVTNLKTTKPLIEKSFRIKLIEKKFQPNFLFGTSLKLNHTIVFLTWFNWLN